MTTLAVAAAASAGAICRYLVDLALRHWARGLVPLGTLAVNLTGSFVLGFLAGLGLHHGLDDRAHAIAGTGFVGAYTTFSTFSYETVRLLADGAHRRAALNIAANTVGGLAAATTGLALAGSG